jgi:myo-inositol-1(or 4)-monophosphatase
MARSGVDWLRFCRRATDQVRTAIRALPAPSDRAVPIGRGEGGDVTVAVDDAAESAILGALEALEVPVTAISEERGEVPFAGGGGPLVVIDPVDGSLNAKRGLPFYAVSIAVAGGATMGDVEFGYVADLGSGEEWWARRGDGAHLGDDRLGPLEERALEVLGLETAHPPRVAAAAIAIEQAASERIRTLGSVALSLCYVAAGRLDAMLSLGPVRSVDAAAAQLLVCEAGGAVAFPEAGPDPGAARLDLGMRSRVVAAATQGEADRLAALFGG